MRYSFLSLFLGRRISKRTLAYYLLLSFKLKRSRQVPNFISCRVKPRSSHISRYSMLDFRVRTFHGLVRRAVSRRSRHGHACYRTQRIADWRINKSYQQISMGICFCFTIMRRKAQRCNKLSPSSSRAYFHASGNTMMPLEKDYRPISSILLSH